MISNRPDIPAISIVIPAKNEAGAIAGLVHEITAALTGTQHEIIVVDDGSTDDTAVRVAALAEALPQLRLVRHAASGGQSAAIHSGVISARGAVICTLDGDGQNPPEDLPRLIAALREAGQGLVAGQRRSRQDSLSKRLASRAANAIRGWALADGTRDTGCGLKAFYRADFLALPYFNHMHRYLPALFRSAGLPVTLVDVGHRPRVAGRSKYGNLQRGLVGAIDLLGVMWLIRRRKTVAPSERD